MSESPRRKRPNGAVERLADSLGISRSYCQQLLGEGMPDGEEAAREWREARATGNSSEELRRERIRLIRIDQKRRQFELERAKKEWLPRSVVEEQQVRIGVVMRLALQQAESDLPPMLEGLPADRMSMVLRDYTTRLLEQLADEDSQLWKKAEGE